MWTSRHHVAIGGSFEKLIIVIHTAPLPVGHHKQDLRPPEALACTRPRTHDQQVEVGIPEREVARRHRGRQSARARAFLSAEHVDYLGIESPQSDVADEQQVVLAAPVRDVIQAHPCVSGERERETMTIDKGKRYIVYERLRVPITLPTLSSEVNLNNAPSVYL